MYLEEYIESSVPDKKALPAQENACPNETALTRAIEDPALDSLWGIFQTPSGHAALRQIARRQEGSRQWIFEKEY